MIEANEDKIMYEITFDLPNAGLETDIIVPPDATNHPAAALTFTPTT